MAKKHIKFHVEIFDNEQDFYTYELTNLKKQIRPKYAQIQDLKKTTHKKWEEMQALGHGEPMRIIKTEQYDRKGWGDLYLYPKGEKPRWQLEPTFKSTPSKIAYGAIPANTKTASTDLLIQEMVTNYISDNSSSAQDALYYTQAKYYQNKELANTILEKIYNNPSTKVSGYLSSEAEIALYRIGKKPALA